MAEKKPVCNYEYPFLRGGGEMGELTRAYDWNNHVLGSPDGWPQSLKTTLSIILNSQFPMFLFWGTEHFCFYNDAYRPSLGNEGKHPGILGAVGITAWAEIWPFIEPLISQVLSGGKATWHEDQLLPIYRNGQMEDVYWTFSYSPVCDESGKPAGVFVTCTETTGKVAAVKELEQTNRELAFSLAAEKSVQLRLRDSEERLSLLITQAPVCIVLLRGRDMVLETANEVGLQVLGKTAVIIGQKLSDGLPELENQPFQQLLENVYDSGIAYHGKATKAIIMRNGALTDVYFDFIYQPIFDDNQRTTAIMVVATEVTEEINSRMKVIDLNNQLAESEERARLAIEASDIGTYDLNLQTDEIITSLRLDQIMGIDGNSPHSDYFSALHPDDVSIRHAAFDIALKTGKLSYQARIIKGEKIRWIQADGRLYKDEQGNPSRMLGTMIDITEQVNAHNAINDANEELACANEELAATNEEMTATTEELTETQQSLFQVNHELLRAYEQARLSKEAAELGTFDMDILKGTMEWDKRCRLLFGISHDDEVSYDKDFVSGLHPEDRDRIINIINDAFVKSKTNGIYDVEYRTVGVEDQKLRWVRAKGQVYFNKAETPVRFIGSVLEITEQKEDELRKNDFIGMVSHELKTPLTSLSAIVQVLNAKLKNNEDKFVPGALEKAATQVKKMSAMINGFLNISRLESSKIIIDKQRFNLEELVAEVIREAEIITSSHFIRFEPCKPVTIEADHDKISSVISNLISNAVKYSPKGKVIDVKCEVIDHTARISIRDEGMGIKPADIPNLFERYYRVQNNHTQHISGFGIGLYLSAEIIHRHDGKIWVESESGIGSTFYFSLPLN